MHVKCLRTIGLLIATQKAYQTFTRIESVFLFKLITKGG